MAGRIELKPRPAFAPLPRRKTPLPWDVSEEAEVARQEIMPPLKRDREPPKQTWVKELEILKIGESLLVVGASRAHVTGTLGVWSKRLGMRFATWEEPEGIRVMRENPAFAGKAKAKDPLDRGNEHGREMAQGEGRAALDKAAAAMFFMDLGSWVGE